MIGKTFGHLGQSCFLKENYSLVEGTPPEINLINEKNNGDEQIVNTCEQIVNQQKKRGRKPKIKETTDEEKIKKMQDCGITVANSPSEIGKTLLNKLSN